MDIVALAVFEGVDHRGAAACIDDFQLVKIQPLLKACVLEHRQWLYAGLIDDNASAVQLVPGECRVCVLRRQKEAVHFVDLSKMYFRWNVAFFQGEKPLRRRGLNHMRGSVDECVHGRCADGGIGPFVIKPFVFQKAAAHSGDDRAVERGEP